MTRICLAAAAAVVLAGAASAAELRVPGGAIAVDATLTNGTEFVYAGTLTGDDTLALDVSGVACILENRDYCTNAAGVVVSGIEPVGTTASFEEGSYGALGLRIAGVGFVQLFAPDAANGLASDAPPTSLSLPATTLAALGFGAFSVENPLIGFYVIDTVVGDNSGGFTVAQAVPAPAAAALFGLAALGLATRRRARG